MLEYSLIIMAFALLGCFAGLTAGLLGIGGGLVIVPGLAYIFQFIDVPQRYIMQIAEGTSLAIMIPTTLRALFAHLRFGIAVWPVFVRMIVGVIVGAIAGAFLAHIVKSEVLSILFGLFLLYMAFRLWFVLTPNPAHQLPGPLGLNLFGVIVGLKSGLLGIGGGVLTIPFLTRWNVSIREAVAVSNAVSFTVAIIGTISFMISGHLVGGLPKWSTGYVYWPAWLPVALVSLLVAPLGVKLSHILSPNVLKRIFAVFLLIVALQMLKVLL